MTSHIINFDQINRVALLRSEAVVRQWLPGGRVAGGEYVVRNPKRYDKRPGSFRINLKTGRWADFATGDTGGDLISLAAFLFDLNQSEAARRLGQMIGAQNDAI